MCICMMVPVFPRKLGYFGLSPQAPNLSDQDGRIKVSLFDHFVEGDVLERVLFDSFSSPNFLDHDSVIIYEDNVILAAMADTSWNDGSDGRTPDNGLGEYSKNGPLWLGKEILLRHISFLFSVTSQNLVNIESPSGPATINDDSCLDGHIQAGPIRIRLSSAGLAVTGPALGRDRSLLFDRI